MKKWTTLTMAIAAMLALSAAPALAGHHHSNRGRERSTSWYRGYGYGGPQQFHARCAYGPRYDAHVVPYRHGVHRYHQQHRHSWYGGDAFYGPGISINTRRLGIRLRF